MRNVWIVDCIPTDPDPQSTEERFTPLHFSCRYLPNVRDDTPDIGSEHEGDGDAVRVTTAHTCRKAVQLLVKCRNLDVNAKNIYGVSSLHMACSRGNAVALEELLTSPSLDVYITDNHGDTALHEACLLGDVGIVQMLLTAMDKKGMNVLLPNHDKQTPLHFACKKGSSHYITCSIHTCTCTHTVHVHVHTLYMCMYTHCTCACTCYTCTMEPL